MGNCIWRVPTELEWWKTERWKRDFECSEDLRSANYDEFQIVRLWGDGAIAAPPPVVVERDAGITDAGTSSAQQVAAGCLFVGRGRLTADHWPTFVCKSPGSRAQWKFFVRKMDLDLSGYVGDQPTHWPLPALIDHQPPEGGRAQGISKAKLHWSFNTLVQSSQDQNFGICLVWPTGISDIKVWPNSSTIMNSCS